MQARRQSFETICKRLRLPLIAAPMFLVSGVDLVVAAAVAGIIGAFPTANCRSAEQLDDWLTQIGRELTTHEQAAGQPAGVCCPNLIVHKSNPQLAEHLAVVARHRPAVVIASVGSPAAVVAPLHDVGTFVFADVATIEHAHKAIAAGADGLVLLSAGAGGQTGWLNPFAFVRAVRAFFDGPIVMAGGISDGTALAAAQTLGCDLGYMGTPMIATHESMAADAYKTMLTECSADDVLLTRAFTGLATNMLRPSIVRAGLDPNALPERGSIDIAKDISVEGRAHRPARWKDIWSAGHSVSAVTATLSVEELIARTERQYQAAKCVRS